MSFPPHMVMPVQAWLVGASLSTGFGLGRWLALPFHVFPQDFLRESVLELTIWGVGPKA